VVFSGIYGDYVQKLAAEENVYLPIIRNYVVLSVESWIAILYVK
jgi:hypothetical protein